MIRRSGRLKALAQQSTASVDRATRPKKTGRTGRTKKDEKVEEQNEKEFKGNEVKIEAETGTEAKQELIEEPAASADVPVKSEEQVTGGAPVPRNFEEIYRHVKEMRKRVVAPVDTMGCERLPEGVSSTITPRVHRFQLLIALMLSSQTKDETNAIAMDTLREGLKPLGGLTLEAIRQTSERDIDRMIFKVGFHNRKAHYIKETAEILHNKFDDETPSTLEDLVSLPGVGPKMAHLFLHRAWGVVAGIGVDVHVHRLANMWGWTGRSKLVPTPERTRVALESWLPRDLWVDINPTLVGFGQTICLPRNPKCDQCTIAPTGLCKGVVRSKLKKAKTELKDIEDIV